MAERRDTHFFGELGALCGALPPYRWSMNEERSTCRECRRLLRTGARSRAAALAFEPEGLPAGDARRGTG